jgi:antitoxin component of MazEF toxin-antitoxin module
MRKQLVRTGNSVTLELEDSELEKLGIDESTEVDVSIEGRVLVVSPVGDKDHSNLIGLSSLPGATLHRQNP